MIEKLRSFAPVIILGVAVLAAGLVWLPRDYGSAGFEQARAQDLEARLGDAATRLAGLIEVTKARPVFHASRRPVVAPEAPKAPEAVLQLLGIIVEDNAKVLAFVKISNGTSLYRIAQGETVGEWQVLDIGKEEIRVSKNGGAPYTLRIGG